MYTISEAKVAVKDAIRGYLCKDAKGNYILEERNRLPIYLEGAPGVGKTEIVEQISKELGIGYISFSLVHHSRNSLLGLPVIRELEDGTKYTSYTMSEIIAKVLESVEGGNGEGILLLDEFPCMSETVMPTMLAFLQTKNIGTHHLPEGWVIVLCGNPPEYNKSARKYDAAIMDRIRKLEIEFNAESFLAYGRETKLEELVLSYLQMHPAHVYDCHEDAKEKVLVTCRGWENLSNALKVYRKLEQAVDKAFIQQFIKSEQISSDFYQYYKQCLVGISKKEMEEILSGYGYEKYRQKISGLSYKQQWILTDYLCELLTVRKTKVEAGMAKYKEISGWLNNVLDMLEAVDEKGVLGEKAYRFINKSELLLKVVSSVKTPAYLRLCEQALVGIGGDVFDE